MQYGQCQCGNRKAWTSGMPFHDCQGCEKCGTTVAYSPDAHRPVQPHKWGTRYDQSTGKPYKVCDDCRHTDPESFAEARKP